MDVGDDVRAILDAPAIPLGVATLPETSGVYILSYGGTVTYVGEAKGSKGLRDRLLSKHLSGDDNHAVQRAFCERFPDRGVRRDYMRTNVRAQWLPIADGHRVSAVERVLICLFDPPWNRK